MVVVRHRLPDIPAAHLMAPDSNSDLTILHHYQGGCRIWSQITILFNTMSCKKKHTRSPRFIETKRLNKLAQWESLLWRRQILCLCSFHHLVYYFPTLLMEFNFRFSQSSRDSLIVLFSPSGPYLAKSFIFLISIAWNKLPLSIRSVRNSNKFRILVKRYHHDHRFLIAGIPDFTK